MLARLRSILRSRRTQAVVGALLLVAFAWWVMPRPVRRVSSVDGSHAWNADQSPSRRQVLWEPPRALADLLPDAKGSLITPRLADAGATLYFSYLPPDGNADVYRSRYQDGRWQPAEPVRELNGDADDLGPALSADG